MVGKVSKISLFLPSVKQLPKASVWSTLFNVAPLTRPWPRRELKRTRARKGLLLTAIRRGNPIDSFFVLPSFFTAAVAAATTATGWEPPLARLVAFRRYRKNERCMPASGTPPPCLLIAVPAGPSLPTPTQCGAILPTQNCPLYDRSLLTRSKSPPSAHQPHAHR